MAAILDESSAFIFDEAGNYILDETGIAPTNASSYIAALWTTVPGFY